LIFYDEYGAIVGVDSESIELFGYKNIKEFKKEVNDISDFFIKEDGYIYKFEHYSWLDFINYSEEPVNKVLIAQKNGNLIEAEISANEIFLMININNSKIIFGVEFVNQIKREKSEFLQPNDTADSIEALKKDVIANDEFKNILSIKENAQKLDIGEDFYNELLQDFFKAHEKYMKRIKKYIEDNHYEEVAKIILILKSICSNLRLFGTIPILNSMQKDIKNKNYKSMQKFLSIYKKDIKSLQDS